MSNDTPLAGYLSTRRSVPAALLVEPAPDGAQLTDILTLASRVPDHGKLAPWRFIVFRGDARHRAGARLAGIVAAREPEADDARLDLERERLSRAPLVVCVVSTAAPHPKIPEWEQTMAAACAALNLVHAVAAHGFASQWLTEWYAYDEEAKAVLGVREHENVVGFVHIGTASERPTDRARPDVAALVTYFGA